jgi:hypothetical protein
MLQGVHPSVKAAETHKVLRASLGPTLEAAGFTRDTGSAAGWRRAETDGTLLLKTQLSQSNWDPRTGGKFTIELQFGAAATPRDGHRRRVGGYVSDDERQKWLRIRNSVAARAHKPSPAFPSAFPASLAPTFLQNFEPMTVLHPSSDLWFPYLSADDVSAWGAFLAGMLPRAVELFLVEARRRATAARSQQPRSKSDE